MKSFWFGGPAPYKTSRSINASVYATLTRAQEMANRPLTGPECVNLIKKLKERKVIETDVESQKVFETFWRELKRHNILFETKPVEAAPAKP